MSDVRLEGIFKRFGDNIALENVDLNLQDREFFVLLGPTGAGKTTTLRVIAGLEKQDQGHVYLDGENVDLVQPADRDVAFVFQQYSLYPSMSVYDNLAFPLRSPLRQTPEDEIKRRVTGAAEILRISHLLDRKTARLSGGEMQRVSIGRAIVREPRIFLMDEPLSNLDAKLRESLRVELKHIQKTQGSTTLFVTHDQIEALTMADRIAVLQDARIVQVGTPHDIYDRPATKFVAQLVGTPRINLVSAARTDGGLNVIGSRMIIPLPANSTGRMPENLTIGVRPEDIRPGSGGYQGELALIEPLGVETILHIKTGDVTLVSVVAGVPPYRLGEPLPFALATERLHYFDSAGKRV